MIEEKTCDCGPECKCDETCSCGGEECQCDETCECGCKHNAEEEIVG